MSLSRRRSVYSATILANPSHQHSPDSQFERAYFQIENATNELIDLLAA
jgi:hypothetical protein